MAPAPTSVIKVGHIDDVQELRKVKPSQVPERFIREKTERPALDKPIPHSSNSIPVIDLSELVNGSKDEFFKLMTSCAEWGFFQVINHGIDVDLVERVEKVAMEFFMMPLEEKQKYQMIPGTVQGYGQAFVFSEDQKLDWCNMFALGVEPHYIRTPKLWPTKPSDFSELSGGYVSGPGISPTLGSHRGDSKTLVSQILSSSNSETVELYSREIKKLCKNLLKYIALTLSLNGDAFEEMFGVAVQAVRMNYYPACPRPDLVLGLSPHSDGSALTILQQGKGSSVGLQILKDDKWIPVQPIPNALVINIGDTIEVLTNGRYKSVEHRAVTHKEKDRLSIVTFYAPSYEIELGPIPELVDDKNPCKYRRYNHGDYSLHYVTNKLQGKKTLEFAKIKN